MSDLDFLLFQMFFTNRRFNSDAFTIIEREKYYTYTDRSYMPHETVRFEFLIWVRSDLFGSSDRNILFFFNSRYLISSSFRITTFHLEFYLKRRSRCLLRNQDYGLGQAETTKKSFSLFLPVPSSDSD